MVSEDHATKKQKREAKLGGKDALHEFGAAVCVPRTGWAALKSTEDLQEGFTEFRALLLKRKFPSGVEIIALRHVKETSYFASRISGIYYRLACKKISGHGCYQKLLLKSVGVMAMLVLGWYYVGISLVLT